MYNSIISKAIRKNVAQDAGTTTSAGSYGGLPKRGGTSNSKYGGDGRVTVGLSTSSSMRSHEQGGKGEVADSANGEQGGVAELEADAVKEVTAYRDEEEAERKEEAPDSCNGVAYAAQ